MQRIVVGLLAIVMACGPHPDDNRDLRVAAESFTGLNAGATQDSILRQLRIDGIKRVFGSPETTAVPVVGSRQGLNDILCDALLRVRTMESAGSSATDEDWKKAGINKMVAGKMYQDSVLSFANALETKLILLSERRRETLEANWSHTCEGMLRPTDIESLVNIYFETLDRSRAEVKISPAMNALLTKLDWPVERGTHKPYISLGFRR